MVLELIQVPTNSDEYNFARKEYTNLTKGTDFVGGMPATLERDCLRQLMKVDNNGTLSYHMTLKVDGERYLLFLSSVGILYFIDRLMHIFTLESGTKRIPLIKTESFLLDGELVLHKEDLCLEYLVFDVLFSQNKSVMMYDYYERYKILASIVTTVFKDYISIYTPNEFIVSVKQWYPLADILETKGGIYEKIAAKTNETRLKKRELVADGLIFQPFDTEYIPYGPWKRNGNIQFKWKPVEKQSMDFKIASNPEKKTEWILLTKSDYPYTMPGSGNKATYQPSKKQRDSIPEGSVVEFTYSLKKNEFKVDRVRPNKTANSLTAIQSVMNYIRDPFKLTDIIKPLQYLLNGKVNLLKEYLSLSTESQLILCIYSHIPTSDFFTKYEKEKLLNFHQKLTPQSELEFKLVRNINKQTSEVDKITFENIFLFAQKYKVQRKITYEVSDRDGNRSVFNTFGDIRTGNSIQNLKKTRKDQLASKMKNSMYQGLTFKCTLSTEDDTNKVIPGKGNLLRFKDRYSFEIHPLWSLDLTLVKSDYYSTESNLQSKPFKFEVEFELKNPLENNFEEFLKSAGWILVSLLSHSGVC
jgi:hypothetical protein